MLRKIVRGLILVPLAFVIVALAVANRHLVTISIDPFSTENPAFAFKMPLFVIILIALIAGVLVGGIAAWNRQRKWRRAARRLERDGRADRRRSEAARYAPSAEVASTTLSSPSAAVSYPRQPAA